MPREIDSTTPDIAAFGVELKRLRMDLSEQLRRLRTDHNALCACLEAAGIIPAKAVEQELNRQHRRRPSHDVSGNKTATKQLRSNSSSMPSDRARTNDSTPRRAPAPATSMSQVARAMPDRTPSYPSQSNGNSEARQRSAPRSLDALSPPRSQEQEGVAHTIDSDLYDLAHPLLYPNVRPAAKAKALEDVRRAITNGKRPDIWRGPDTPLLGALEAGSRELVQLLILCRANPNVQNDKGASVLHRSVFHGEIDYVVMFLEAQADPNLGDRHDQTPLFFAPTTHICDILCRRNADTNIVNLKGQSALHLAALANLGDVLVWLAQNVSRQLLDMRDNDGNSAEDYALREGMKPEVVKRMRPYDPHHPVKRAPKSRSKRPTLKKSMKRSSQVSSRSSEASAHVDDGTQQIDDDTIGLQQTDEVGYVEGEEDDENLSATIKIGEEENEPEQDDDLAPKGDTNEVAEDVVDLEQEETNEADELPLPAAESELDPTKSLATSKKSRGFGISGMFRSNKSVKQTEQ